MVLEHGPPLCARAPSTAAARGRAALRGSRRTNRGRGWRSSCSIFAETAPRALARRPMRSMPGPLRRRVRSAGRRGRLRATARNMTRVTRQPIPAGRSPGTATMMLVALGGRVAAAQPHSTSGSPADVPCATSYAVATACCARCPTRIRRRRNRVRSRIPTSTRCVRGDSQSSTAGRCLRSARSASRRLLIYAAPSPSRSTTTLGVPALHL